MLFSARFVSPHHKSLAAAVRLCLTDAKEYKLQARRLAKQRQDSTELHTMALWKDWYDSAFYTRLGEAYEYANSLGISPTRTLGILLMTYKGQENWVRTAYSKLEGALYGLIINTSI